MIRNFFIFLGLISTFLAFALGCLFFLDLAAVAVPFEPETSPPSKKILLIPLDSRPPCTDYVVDLGRMAGYQVLVPPRNFLDDYRQPANTKALRNWLFREIGSADAAILSVDMLVHGGLWASRQALDYAATAEAVITDLQRLHQEQPHIKLYAFSILPRLFIAENSETKEFKELMAEWSALQETTLRFGDPQDSLRLQLLEATIPPEIIRHYQNLYNANAKLNFQLVELVNAGVLSGLVLGQDDSGTFGLGNLQRRRLDDKLAQEPGLQKKIITMRGTDEVALSMLSRMPRTDSNSRTKVYVHYTESHTAETIMPYMPASLSRTVSEKLAMSEAMQVSSAKNADYILVVHAGNSNSQRGNLAIEAERIKSWLKSGQNVALVDLAFDWIPGQTLLPHLQRNSAPIPQLLAYAGWNTASNSVGTAVTQAEMVLRGRTATEFNTRLGRDLHRIGFLAERLLDDWYYQKNYREILNEILRSQSIDPYNLLQNRTKVTNRIHHALSNEYIRLIRRGWKNEIIPLETGGPGVYTVADWRLRSGLPWARTFEIQLDLQPLPALLINQ